MFLDHPISCFDMFCTSVDLHVRIMVRFRVGVSIKTRARVFILRCHQPDIVYAMCSCNVANMRSKL